MPARAAALLRDLLPARIAARVDWSTLAQVAGDRIGELLEERRADLVLSAKVGGRSTYFVFLLEHRSSPDPRMVLRAIEYALVLSNHCLDADPRALIPPVVPVVVHHGAEGWTAARSLRELTGLDDDLAEALGPNVLSLELLIDDLVRVSPRDIAARRADALTRLVLGMLRDARSAVSVDELLARWTDLVREVVASDPHLDAAFLVFRYIAMVRDERLGGVVDAARRIGPEVEGAAVTLYERLIEQGMAQGMAQGKSEGKAELVTKLLTLRFGPPSTELVARVRGATEAELDAMAERVLGAARIEDVLA